MRQGGNLGISPAEGLRWQPSGVAETTYLTAVGPNGKVGSAAVYGIPAGAAGTSVLQCGETPGKAPHVPSVGGPTAFILILLHLPHLAFLPCSPPVSIVPSLLSLDPMVHP